MSSEVPLEKGAYEIVIGHKRERLEKKCHTHSRGRQNQPNAISFIFDIIPFFFFFFLLSFKFKTLENVPPPVGWKRKNCLDGDVFGMLLWSSQVHGFKRV